MCMPSSSDLAPSSAQGWTEKQRNLLWTVLSAMRVELNLSISPIVATAFVLIQNYFSKRNEMKSSLYLLAVSSMFLSCKIEDTYRPLDTVFKAFSHVCTYFKEHSRYNIPFAILGERDFSNCTMTNEEISKIAPIEIDLLNSIEWKLDIDLPFTYIRSHVNISQSDDDGNECIKGVCDSILRNICLLMRSGQYLELSPCVIAAASTSEAFGSLSSPPNVSEWVSQVKSESPEQFQQITEIIRSQQSACIKMKPRAPMKKK